MLRSSTGTLLLAGVLSSLGPSADTEPEKAFMTCARACADCQLRCDACHRHCLGLVAGGEKHHVRTAQLCVDCAACCQLAASFSARQSPLVSHACNCCAKCCDDCAAACEQSASDEVMANCAKECRACAKACRDMVQQIKPGA
jgi:hypothetical protein